MQCPLNRGCLLYGVSIKGGSTVLHLDNNYIVHSNAEVAELFLAIQIIRVSTVCIIIIL